MGRCSRSKRKAFLQKRHGLFQQAAAAVFIAEKAGRFVLFMQQTAEPVSDFGCQELVMIGFFHHRKVRIQTTLYRIRPQQAAAETVNSTDLGLVQSFQLLFPVGPLLPRFQFPFHFPADSVPHLRRSFPGKGNRQYFPGKYGFFRMRSPPAYQVQEALHQDTGFGSPPAYQVQEALHKDTGFPAASAGRDRNICIYTMNRPFLRRRKLQFTHGVPPRPDPAVKFGNGRFSLPGSKRHTCPCVWDGTLPAPYNTGYLPEPVPFFPAKPLYR